MRRITIIEPVSRFAVWSRRMALLSLASSGLALYLTRARLVDLDAGMAAILGGLVIAAIALGLALAAFSRIWYLGRRGFASAVTGFVLTLLVLALPLYIAGLRLHAPQSRDISTDPQTPPAFVAPDELASTARATRPAPTLPRSTEEKAPPNDSGTLGARPGPWYVPLYPYCPPAASEEEETGEAAPPQKLALDL